MSERKNHYLMLYHYSLSSLDMGETLYPGSWLTDTKGCALFQEIQRALTDPALAFFEHLILVNETQVKKTRANRQKTVTWYTVKQPDTAKVASVKTITYQQLQYALQEAKQKNNY